MDLVLEDNRLSKVLTNGRKVLVVPQSQTRTVFDQFHSGTFGGHGSFHKTVRMMSKYVYWPEMARDVRKWVKKCFKCAHINRQRKTVPPLKPILSRHPYELVGIDVFSLGLTSSGYHYVVTVIDHHSKFCAAYPVADKTAKTIAQVFWENWCLREGRMPTCLLSDRGGEFLNEITDEIRALTGMDQKFTVGHNPRENGITERMNETLKGLLMKMSDGTSEWDQRLPYALFFYNSSPHKATGESPFFLLHGADANFPVCGVPSTAVSPYTVDVDTYKMELARGMKALHEAAAERIGEQAEAMKKYYDRVHQVEKTQVFKLFDRVFVYNPNVGADRDSTKLTPQWEGPFRIVEMSDNSATVRFLGPQKLEKRVQLDFLKRVPAEVVNDEFYLYKPDKKRGRPRGGRNQQKDAQTELRRSKRTVRFEIRGGALDYKVGCGCHLQMKLDQVPGVKQPPGSSSWSASSPFGLAQGVHVAESVTFSADDQEAFFLKKADALVRIGCVEPSEDLMVKVVVQVARLCPAVMDVFAQTQRAQYTCDLGFNKGKADMRIRVAEKARAILDGERALQTAETIVIGGVNAVRFAAELGQEAIKCETLVELRQFLEASHFSSTVKRVFVWPDTKENFVASTYVKYLKEAVTAAAQWKHVVFIVLPMPFAHADVSRFESYMIEFNTDPPKLDNVLWLDDSWLFKGYRFSRSLGANEIAVDEKAVFPEGSISKRGAAAAVKFLKGLCAWLIIDTAGQGAGLQTSGPSTSGNQLAGPHQVLHGVREGKVAKQQARGVPSRGGGGGRQSRGRGNSNAGNRHRQGQPK
ncbi:gagpol and env protein precursor [Aphelenchoides avenae]|nr:gagpol and env protein precursor [Aphelenchus avenae]